MLNYWYHSFGAMLHTHHPFFIDQEEIKLLECSKSDMSELFSNWYVTDPQCDKVLIFQTLIPENQGREREMPLGR